MRILLVTPFIPHPGAPHGGGALLGTLAEGLSRRAEIGLVAIAGPQEAAAVETGPWSYRAIAKIASRPTGAALLPHRLRMLWRWRSLPLVAAKIAAAPVPALLRRARADFEPDVALVEMAQMAQFLPALHGLPNILTDHEAGCSANIRTGLGALGDQRDRRLWRRFVRRFYPQAGALQALTGEDAAVLAAATEREVAVRAPVFPVPEAPVAAGRAPPRALFFGDYSHGPNPEAARLLVHRVLPRLRDAVPDAELWLAGRHDEPIHELGSLPGVRLLGYVPDLGGLLAQVRVVLAPVFSGSGVRIKCIAAHAHGLPVVTNTLGAQGLDAPPTARTLAEGPEALAEATIALLRSPERATAIGRAGHDWARHAVHVDAVAEAQIERARALLDRGQAGED